VIDQSKQTETETEMSESHEAGDECSQDGSRN
jgi:hypothetical protein